MKKRGIRAQSQLITTILLIVLVLAAIVIVWAVVNNLITESAEEIGTSALTTRLEIKEANLWVTGGAEVIVKREPGEGEITSLKFIFYNEDGGNVIIEETEEIPKEIETKIYDFDINDHPELYNINKVSVVPVFGEKLGMEFFETKPNTDAAISELVSWWKFDGNARDSVGENHGTANGGVDLNYDDAVRGKVASFDGADDYVDCGNSLDLSYQNFTISTWFNQEPTTSCCKALLGRGGSFLIWGYDVLDFSVMNETWPGGGHGTSIPTLPFNEWHHVVGIFNNTHVLLYLDGAYQTSEPFSGNFVDSSLNLAIGTQCVGCASFFNGTIDDIIIFNKALSENQTKAIYNNQIK